MNEGNTNYTTIVTCKKCRAWYNMDMEEYLDNQHFDMRTGEMCYAEDDGWEITTNVYREDWRIVY